MFSNLSLFLPAMLPASQLRYCLPCEPTETHAYPQTLRWKTQRGGSRKEQRTNTLPQTSTSAMFVLIFQKLEITSFTVFQKILHTFLSPTLIFCIIISLDLTTVVQYLISLISILIHNSYGGFSFTDFVKPEVTTVISPVPHAHLQWTCYSSIK